MCSKHRRILEISKFHRAMTANFSCYVVLKGGGGLIWENSSTHTLAAGPLPGSQGSVDELLLGPDGMVPYDHVLSKNPMQAHHLSRRLITQFVATCLVGLIRRRFFHPMSSAPGPWLDSVTEIPAFLALVTENQHTYYRRLHETYGPVVRVSPNELSFVNLEAREEIYGLRVL